MLRPADQPVTTGDEWRSAAQYQSPRRYGCRPRRRGRRRALSDGAIARQLRAPGAEVVRAAGQFQAEGTCDYADDRQFARHDHAVQPEASSPAS
jgi:hypothetical protein